MHDPHIDIDDLDDAAAAGKSPLADQFKAAEAAGLNPNLGDMFMGMNQMLRQWQEQLSGNFRLLPDETVKHFRASQREWLLAWRSLLDASLEKLEHQEMRDELRKEANLATEPISPRASHKIIVEEFEG